ncbi:MAG TPA: glycosyltransferase family 9 protein [Candidatus Eisenbacteria bacterium]|nr:glycosyltransferase family 9 protein [Candidatus Eisenbacteria bacterium]
MMAMLCFVMIPTWLAMVRRKYLAGATRTSRRAEVPRDIIVFCLDQLGDLVLTTPLFRELKRLYPSARCAVVVPSEYKTILATNRHVDDILPFQLVKARWLPARAQRLASALWFYRTVLWRRYFDLAIVPRWDLDESLATLLCELTNAGTRVGHSAQASAAKQRFNRGFDAAFDVLVPSGPVQHEVDRNLAIVEALGGTVGSRQLEICLTENDRKFASELLKHHDRHRLLVAVGIGGRAASRKWPLQRYAECIARLHHERIVQPVIVCSAAEDAEASALSVMLPVPPYILSGVPLRAVGAVLEQCDLFVGNDSGTAHLAAAMECPTVVVSRHPANGDRNHANSPARFGPRCAVSRVVQPVTGAGGCVASCRSAEPHCILRVTVDRVVAAALEMLPREVPAKFRTIVPLNSRATLPAEARPDGALGPA